MMVIFLNSGSFMLAKVLNQVLSLHNTSTTSLTFNNDPVLQYYYTNEGYSNKKQLLLLNPPFISTALLMFQMLCIATLLCSSSSLVTAIIQASSFTIVILVMMTLSVWNHNNNVFDKVAMEITAESTLLSVTMLIMLVAMNFPFYFSNEITSKIAISSYCILSIANSIFAPKITNKWYKL